MADPRVAAVDVLGEGAVVHLARGLVVAVDDACAGQTRELSCTAGS